jgi:signal transduction histidine kinase
MRILISLLLIGLSTLVWSQPVLTITNARQPNPVAPYGYFLEDFTHKLTYDQVSRFPLDSFQTINRKEVVQLAYRAGTIWMRFAISNSTNKELFLISSYRRYKQLDVFILDDYAQQTHIRSGYDLPIDSQLIPVNPPVISLGRHPRQVHLKILTIDAYGDYLHIGDLSQAFVYKQKTIRWQNLALGAFLIAFLFALVFFIRLRDPLIGWYAVLMFSLVLFYIDFYDLLSGFLNYSLWRQYVPTAFIYLSCWALFHIKFLNLHHYSKTLYWLIIGINCVYWIDWPISMLVTELTGSYYSLLYKLLYWMGIDWGGYIQIVLFLLLVSLIYVSFKTRQNIFLYTIAFLISLVAMIISMFALYGLGWLPSVPYNNMFVPGTLIEIVMLGYILGERANQHRKQQNQTQQQLIEQLQENLHQKNELLQIRDEIARDLHDEVGATLTAIAISTKLVQKKVGPERTEVTPILEQIQINSQDTIHSLRDTVWALNPDNDAPEKLIERMRAVGLQLLTAQGIGFLFECDVPDQDLPVLSMEQRRHIYFVFREALHNIVKHGQATCTVVIITRRGNEMNIRITDNGIGFEPTFTGEGNGLKNFRKRACEGNFQVMVCSVVGRGTTVEMQIPVRETSRTG